MSLVRRWWKPALALVVLLIALQVGVSLLVRTHRVHSYLVARLERAFGRPLEVRRFNVQILPSPQLDADGITVGEDPAFGNEYFLRAEHFSAGLRWLGLLRGHFDFGTLKLSRPSLVLVRNDQGTWNLERWLPPARSNPADAARVYGPPSAPPPANRLEKIEFEDGRVNFKVGDEKEAFAFIGVTGSVEQVSRGRWRLQLEARPWRSGVELQSPGFVRVRGDIAGTSVRLQPAQIDVHWGEVSLADLFRLAGGRDYGVRGTFALDLAGKVGGADGSGPGEWAITLRARAARIRRWDLTERADNPQLRLALDGTWNPTLRTASAEHVILEAPKSNLRGTLKMEMGPGAGLEARVDSMGIQAADLLAWYRAFQPGVQEDVVADAYFTGAATFRGWNLELADAAFSSPGGTVRLPRAEETLRIGPIRGGRGRAALVVDPVRVTLVERPAVGVGRSDSAPPRKKPEAARSTVVEVGFTHDFDTGEGGIRTGGHAERVADVLNLAAAFGRPLNHGWELTGPASADLSWNWSRGSHGRWDGSVQVSDGQLEAAGLNQPLALEDARLEWHQGGRVAKLGRVGGFGAIWSGDIAEIGAPSGAGDERRWNFHLHADKLNAAELDLWVGPRARPGWLERLLPSVLGGSTPVVPASELVRRVNAEGELRVDEFTLEKLKLNQVRVVGSLRDLKLDVTDGEAQWAGGKVRGSVRAAFLPRPEYRARIELDRVNLSLTPWTGKAAERFGGIASGRLDLATKGVGREELLGNLEGQGSVTLKSVEFRGWDLSASLVEGAPQTGASRWTTGEGTFTVRDHRVVLGALRLDSAREQTFVQGQVTFAKEAALTIETVKPGRGVSDTRPVRILKIDGPLDGPRVSVTRLVVSQPAD